MQPSPTADASVPIPLSLETWIAKLGLEADSAGEAPAWQRAGPFGAVAVPPLADVMARGGGEKARAAKRALWCVVDHAGRPGGQREAAAVVEALVSAVGQKGLPVPVIRELLWMLGTLGGDGCVAHVAAWLGSEELREDARCVLQRIPGEASLKALREALDHASGMFEVALADALRARGEVVPGRPGRSRIPERSTRVGTGV